jgi:hypothetical protein
MAAKSLGAEGCAGWALIETDSQGAAAGRDVRFAGESAEP